MEEKVQELNNYLSFYFQCCSEKGPVEQASRQLCSFGEDPNFIDIAVSLLSRPNLTE